MEQQTGLIETMYWDGHNIDLWPYHLRRLQKGIRYYAFPADEDELREQVMARLHDFGAGTPCKVRLEVYADRTDIQITRFSRDPERTIRLGLAEGLVIQEHSTTGLKTTQRELYREAQIQAIAGGVDDVLLPNEQGHWVETSIFNLIWQSASGACYTPLRSEGCIDGVMRAYLLAQQRISEAILDQASLAQASAVWVCNALRGILPVVQISAQHYSPYTFPYSK